MGSIATCSERTILVIPGACSPAPLYYDLVSNIQSLSGIATVVHGLPSGNRLPPQPPAGLADDAVFIGSKIKELVDAGQDVVLVPHSYGGLVASEAAKGLTKQERLDAELPGGVISIVYLTCVVAEKGQSSGEMCAPLKLDWMIPLEEVSHPFLTLEYIIILILQQSDQFMYNTDAGIHRVFSDMPQDKALAAIRSMSASSVISFNEKVTHEAFRDTPVSYIFCEKDAVLTPEWQMDRIEFLKNARHDGKVNVVRFDAGHCPNVSNPMGAARKVIEAMESI